MIEKAGIALVGVRRRGLIGVEGSRRANLWSAGELRLHLVRNQLYDFIAFDRSGIADRVKHKLPGFFELVVYAGDHDFQRQHQILRGRLWNFDISGMAFGFGHRLPEWTTRLAE